MKKSLFKIYSDSITFEQGRTKHTEEELHKIILYGPEDKKEAARNELVIQNLSYVISAAVKIAGPYSDLNVIQAGNEGLIEAAKRFEPERGFKFITYATWWIRQFIIQ